MKKKRVASSAKTSASGRLKVAGLELSAYRTRAGVTLDQVIERTKISRHFLEAIESGCYQELPGGVFSRSYLKQYSEVVGIEARILLEHYKQVVPGDATPGEASAAAAATPRWMKAILPGL